MSVAPRCLNQVTGHSMHLHHCLSLQVLFPTCFIRLVSALSQTLHL
jgi:hypothetical protein